MTRSHVALALMLLATGCGQSHPSDGARTVVVHVVGAANRTQPANCVFAIRASIDGGGSSETCLTRVDGFPVAGGTIRSRGLMTLRLAGGAIRARVSVVQRFGPDGTRARQSLTGTVTGGSGRFAGARGRVTGGGTLRDSRAALDRLRLVYRVTLQP